MGFITILKVWAADRHVGSLLRAQPREDAASAPQRHVAPFACEPGSHALLLVSMCLTLMRNMNVMSLSIGQT